MGLAAFFVGRFIRNVDKELDNLRAKAGKTAIDLTERAAEIKVSLAGIESTAKGTHDRVKFLAKENEKITERLSTHQEYHAKTAKILRTQKEKIEKIETIVKKVGENTYVSERRRQKR